MTPRIRLLAWIYLVMSGLCLSVGTVLCIGLLVSRDPQSGNALLVIGPAFLALSILYFIPGLFGGIGLLRRKPWARTVIIVLSLVGIPLFPVGTALGGFGLWVLLGRDKRQFAPPPARPQQSADRPAPVEPPSTSGYGARWHGDREQLAEHRRQGDEERRLRLAALDVDPVRRKYVERIERGESWSDAQIDYAENPDRLATCVHLQPIERGMRAGGVEVRLELRSRVSARCCVDHEALRERFALPPFVHYSEPTSHGRSFEDPPAALITCDECKSMIHVVHRLEAEPGTPLFPAAAAAPNVSPSHVTERPADEVSRLRARIDELAEVIGAPEHVLPTFGYSEETSRPHIEIQGTTFDYVTRERGREYDRFSTVSVDELLYRVFRDVTFSMAATHEGVSQVTGTARRRILRYQVTLLGRLDAGWASRRAAEH